MPHFGEDYEMWRISCEKQTTTLNEFSQFLSRCGHRCVHTADYIASTASAAAPEQEEGQFLVELSVKK